MNFSGHTIHNQKGIQSRLLSNAELSGYMETWNMMDDGQPFKDSMLKNQLFFYARMLLQEAWIFQKLDILFSMTLQGRLQNMCIGIYTLTYIGPLLCIFLKWFTLMSLVIPMHAKSLRS